MAKVQNVEVQVHVEGLEELKAEVQKLNNKIMDDYYLRNLSTEVASMAKGVSYHEVAFTRSDSGPRPNNSRHPLSQKFHDLLDEAGELHDKKQADYGVDNDPFANIRASTDWGLDPWVGAMLRTTDKVKRLQAFAQKGSLKNESARDSLMDIAVYSLIAIVLMEEENEDISSG